MKICGNTSCIISSVSGSWLVVRNTIPMFSLRSIPLPYSGNIVTHGWFLLGLFTTFSRACQWPKTSELSSIWSAQRWRRRASRRSSTRPSGPSFVLHPSPRRSGLVGFSENVLPIWSRNSCLKKFDKRKKKRHKWSKGEKKSSCYFYSGLLVWGKLASLLIFEGWRYPAKAWILLWTPSATSAAAPTLTATATTRATKRSLKHQKLGLKIKQKWEMKWLAIF